MTAFLDKETLELIQETAQKSVARQLLPLPNNPEEYLLLGDGQREVVSCPYVPPPRQHTVQLLGSFAAAYERWCFSADDVKLPAGVEQAKLPPAIWVDLDKWRLTFFVDEPLRRGWVKLVLTPSPQLLLLLGYRNEKTLEQKALVRLLRHDLKDCVEPGVLAAFRSLDFQKIRNTRASLEHGKQSLDGDLVAQVVGEKKPEDFLVELPLFAMQELRDLKSRVRLTIDIDCDNCRFGLQALPGQLDEALDDAREGVIRELQLLLSNFGFEAGSVTILAGTPGAGLTKEA